VEQLLFSFDPIRCFWARWALFFLFGYSVGASNIAAKSFSNMKDKLKLISSVIGGLIGLLTSIYFASNVFGYFMDLVPKGDYQAIFRCLVAFIVFWIFGGLMILVSFLITMILGAVGSAIVDFIVPDKKKVKSWRDL
jgi:hypothetical protein